MSPLSDHDLSQRDAELSPAAVLTGLNELTVRMKVRPSVMFNELAATSNKEDIASTSHLSGNAVLRPAQADSPQSLHKLMIFYSWTQWPVQLRMLESACSDLSLKSMFCAVVDRSSHEASLS